MPRARITRLLLCSLPLVVTISAPASAGSLRPVHGASAAAEGAGHTASSQCLGPCVSTQPGPSLSHTQLTAVTAVSASDIWAVGYSIDETHSVRETLTEHYDGSHWSVVPSPSPGVRENELFAVSAIGPDDVWAVGVTGADTGSFDLRTLAEHWDGAGWTVVPTPTPNRGGQLNGVAALSPTDVWAVGEYFTNSVEKTLVLHFDGSEWSVAGSPSPSTNQSLLSGIAAPSSDSIWAVGARFKDTGVTRTLIEHYDGTAWTRQASPNLGSGDNQLASVAAVSSTEAWAVGTTARPANAATRPLTEHFVSGTWQVVRAAVPPGFFRRFTGVAAVSAGDVWAVGDYSAVDGGHTLIEHYDGSGWAIVPSPDPSEAPQLSGVTAVSGTDVWAVGSYSFEGRGFPLILHYGGVGWTVFPAPNADQGDALYAVDGSSATDIWAVGGRSEPAAGTERPLIEHFDGNTWQSVHAPGRSVSSVLSDVSVLSASDAWAVGSFLNQGLRPRTLIEHWDSSAWTLFPSPNPETTSDILLGVVALGASDVFAVGTSAGSGFGSSTLVEHYDGSSWSVVSSANPATFNKLFGIGASSATDLWAVGGAANGPFPQTLAEHGDEAGLSAVSTPNPSSTGNNLFAVGTLASNDVWAVGSQIDFQGHDQTLVEHYNGTGWKAVNGASLGVSTSKLLGVSGSSTSDVWAVGLVANARGLQTTLAEQFDGTSWSRAQTPSPGKRLSVLSDVFALSAGDVWAVGGVLGSEARGRTLIEHFDGVSWTVVDSPNP